MVSHYYFFILDTIKHKYMYNDLLDISLSTVDCKNTETILRK